MPLRCCSLSRRAWRRTVRLPAFSVWVRYASTDSHRHTCIRSLALVQDVSAYKTRIARLEQTERSATEACLLALRTPGQSDLSPA